LKRFALAAAAMGLIVPLAHADEGMWTYDNFPTAQVKAKFGSAPDQAWLDKVRQSSVRLSSGCSASMVSPTGLVLTNWHCVSDCVQNLSSKDNDHTNQGFMTKARTEEKICPGVQADVLTTIGDVTGRVQAAVKGKTGADFSKARDGEIATIESEACKDKPDAKCEVVSLYRGGRFALHTYRTYKDVRLVFAPEFGIGFFGGDPDNFNFPRYNLDSALLRVYDEGQPATVTNFLPWRSDPLKDGEQVFVSGHPGSTSRLATQSQLAFERDHTIPLRQLVRSELRGRLYQYMAEGEDQRRATMETAFSAENGFKAFYGRWNALADPTFQAQKAKDEAAMKSRLGARPDLAKEIGDPWADIDKAMATAETLYLENDLLETRAGSISQMYSFAKTLVRGATERAKPNNQRLPGYSDSRLAQLEQSLLAETSINPDHERIGLELWLSKAREFLTVDHPAVKQILGKESPEALARRLVAGSKLNDPKVREALWEGGPDAIAKSDDPLIVLVRANEPNARAIADQWRARVSGPVAQAAERIAKARFALYGSEVYPDATFTLRLSYGAVKGWEHNGRTVASFTQMGGLYDRATGAFPFVLPQRWLDAKSKLDPAMNFNVSTTNDIIGGNSGSPLIDAQGRVVGAVFDGNIHSLGGDYYYDPTLNRAVSVLTPPITAALRHVYDMPQIADELEKGAAAKPAKRRK